MTSSRSNRLPDVPELHPDIVVNYLQRLGVTPETTKAIRDEVRVEIDAVVISVCCRLWPSLYIYRSIRQQQSKPLLI